MIDDDPTELWEQMDDVSRQIREARDDAAREQLAAAHAMLRTVWVEAQGAPPGWVMMKSWVIREVEALLASADPGVAPESGELLVSERAYEEIAGERDRPGEAIPALVDLFERSKDDLMSDTVETGPDGLVDRVAKVFTVATFWLIKDDALVREVAEAFRAGARVAITEVRAHDQPVAIETVAEPRCARFGGRPTCPEAEEFYCRVHCYHEQPGAPVSGPGGRGPDVACWECGSAHAGNVCPPIMDPPPPDPVVCKTCGGSKKIPNRRIAPNGRLSDLGPEFIPCFVCCGGSGRTDRSTS